MICIQKIYGFHGPNHQIIEESWDVTPVTRDERTDGKWKIEQCSELNQKPQYFVLSCLRKSKISWMGNRHLSLSRRQCCKGRTSPEHSDGWRNWKPNFFFVEDDILSLLWVIAVSELYNKSLSGTRADDLGCLKVKEKHVFKHFLVAEHAPPCLWSFWNMFPHSNLVSAPVILESKRP